MFLNITPKGFAAAIHMFIWSYEFYLITFHLNTALLVGSLLTESMAAPNSISQSLDPSFC